MLLQRNLPQNARNSVAVSNIATTKKKEKQVRQIIGTKHQLPIFHPFFKFFVVKLKLMRKSSNFLLLCVTLPSYSCYDLSYFNQVAKIVKFKHVPLHKK